jgi:hypothetical protein
MRDRVGQGVRGFVFGAWSGAATHGGHVPNMTRVDHGDF